MNKTIVKVGFFLAYRQIKHASLWTTVLIIFVMMLTFLNLVVVNGVLVGLIQSSVMAERTKYTGDVIISNLQQKSYIDQSHTIIDVLKGLPAVVDVSPRYLGAGKLNADYNRKLNNDEVPNTAVATLAGIDPVVEDRVTHLSKYLVEGSYLSADDPDGVIIGANLLYKYTKIDAPGLQLLRKVGVGDRIKITVGKNSKEVIIRGAIKSKVGENDIRVFMIQSEARKLIGSPNDDYDEIAVLLKKGSTLADSARIKQILVDNGFDDGAKIQTFEEAQPKFLKDIAATFGILGNLIGSIGLAVASITIFIVIFVNAITRRKFIGILKGIGIDSTSIKVSYVFQSIFYAFAGTGLGLAVLYGFLMPYVDAHPINFPFSDGIIYAPFPGTMLRVLVLMITTVVAGYIPARLIVNRNTLDAILGR